MRILSVRSLLLTSAISLCSLAAQSQSAEEAVARQYLDAFNVGDMAKVNAFNVSSSVNIVDEFAPYLWSGPRGFTDWSAAFEANAKAHGITDTKVTLGKIVVDNATATQAYLIFPSVYTYKEKGVSIHEVAHMAIVMRKEGGNWKVAGFTWAGTVPKAAGK